MRGIDQSSMACPGKGPIIRKLDVSSVIDLRCHVAHVKSLQCHEICEWLCYAMLCFVMVVFFYSNVVYLPVSLSTGHRWQ